MELKIGLLKVRGYAILLSLVLSLVLCFYVVLCLVCFFVCFICFVLSMEWMR